MPKAADSDGDGVTDDKDKCPNTPAGRKVNAEGCEAVAPTPAPVADTRAQTMPLNLAPPASEPAPLLKPLVLEGVNFDYNQATLTDAGRAIIDQNAETLNQWANTRIVISGHTDSRGSDQYNLDLSLRRAMTVRDYLISKGIASNLMITRGLGEAQPVADNNTDDGRSKNRRVELKPLQ